MSVLVVLVTVGGAAMAGIACNKRDSPPFSSDNDRWARVELAAKPGLAVTALADITNVATLLSLAKHKRGFAFSCDKSVPAGINSVVGQALALATGPDSPELHAVIYIGRLLRANGSGLVSLLLGSYMARRVVNWAAKHHVTAIDTEPLVARSERRAIAADVLCVWRRYQAQGARKGAAVLRGYLETIALETSTTALSEHQRIAFVYQGDYPALAAAPRSYVRYLAKARGHREAFNALIKR